MTPIQRGNAFQRRPAAHRGITDHQTSNDIDQINAPDNQPSTAVQRRGTWDVLEDDYLIRLIDQYGPHNWVLIANKIGHRTPKQCRERYHQNLKPTLRHDPISPQEGLEIETLVARFGRRWADISRRLPGRSDNAVKNWWNGNQNRRKRLSRRLAAREAPSPSSSSSSSPALNTAQQPLPALSPVLPIRSVSYPRTPTFGQSDRKMSFADAALPSPCSSESPDLESRSSFTISPALPSLSSVPINPGQPRYALPPLRGWLEPRATESRLPGVGSMGQCGDGSSSRNGTRLPSLFSSFRPMTAPSSPVQHLQREGSEQKNETSQCGQSQPSEPGPQLSPLTLPNPHNGIRRTSNKMKLESLLG